MANKYTRTDKDFVIESIAVLREVVQTHTNAGFEHVPDSIVHRRFFQLVKFLQDNCLTIRILFTDESTLDDNAELKNSDVNDKGFYFLQENLGKWEGRLYKDKGEKKEWAFLEKWYSAFLEKTSIELKSVE